MKPNVIFYFSDQQRQDTICPEVTPNLYGFAKDDGIEGSLTFTCQPVCGPARACIQTGLYASKNGCFRNDIAINEDLPCIGKLFSGAGYDTAYIGKWHLASDAFNHNAKKAIPKNKQGGYKHIRMADCLEFTSNGKKGYVFDENGERIDFEGVRSDCINDFALEYIDKKDMAKPFFMFISQLEPHHQNDSNKFECAEEYVGKFDNYPLPSDLVNQGGNAKGNYANYLALCHRLDKNVGDLAQKLKDKNLWNSTVVIYTADHGCHFRTRNMEYKRSAHDNSTHIPFILFGGGVKALLEDRKINLKLPSKYDDLLSLIDFAPTLLDIGGITVPDTFDGYSLLDLLSGKVAPRDNVYIEISESQLGRAIRTKDYIYSVKAPRNLGLFSAHAKKYREDLLYDLVLDSANLNNLIKDKNLIPVRDKMKKILLKEISKTISATPKIIKKFSFFR